MADKYKRIVLLQGLEKMSDYQFRMVKSLLNKELKLTKKMQEEHDRIRIADLMEDKFPKDAGLGELIKVCEDMSDIGNIPDTLKKERTKVQNENKRTAKAAKKRSKQEGPSTSQPKSPTNKDVDLEPTKEMPSSKKKKTVKTEGSKMPNEEQNQLLEPSASNTQQAEGFPEIPRMPPPTLSPSSSIKKSKGTSLQTQKQQLMELSTSSRCPSVSAAQTPQGSPATASSHVQAPRVPPAISSSSLQTKMPSQPSYVLVHTHTGTPAGAFILHQTSNMSPATSSSSLQCPQVLLRPSVNGQDTLMAPVTPANSAHAPPTISLNDLLASGVSPAKGPSGLCTPQMLPTSTSRSHLALKVPPASACSIIPTPKASPATVSKRPRLNNIPKEPSREDDYQTGPKEVMVLKATEPFTYETREGKKMFHATVATKHEFFRVKVFDITLKEKFIPDNVIAISHYYGRNGFLEIYNAFCVSGVNTSQKMDISETLKRNANATPKINYLCSQERGTFVNGVFMVYKKNVRNECTYYGIRDETGMMEVVVYGRLTKINCEAGDKLRLFCFELASTMDIKQLRSVMHSHMEVIKART